MNAYDIRSNQLVKYMKLHLISLEQDHALVDKEMEDVDLASKDADEMDVEMISLNGQIIATRHLLSVASDILGIPTEEE